MKSDVLELMTQLAQATNLSHQQRIMLLQMETRLHMLREKLEAHEEASRARSNGAAAPKVVQKNKHTATSPLPELHSSVPVLKEVAVVEELHEEDTKKRLGDVQTVQKDKPKKRRKKATTSSTTPKNPIFPVKETRVKMMTDVT